MPKGNTTEQEDRAALIITGRLKVTNNALYPYAVYANSIQRGCLSRQGRVVIKGLQSYPPCALGARVLYCSKTLDEETMP